MATKRILHLISSLKIGGAESWLLDLLAHLPHEYEHHVLYFHDGPNRERLKERGIALYHIRPAFYNPLFYYRVYKAIRSINPDLIHSSLWAANLVGRLCGRMLNIPVVSTIHLGMDEDGPIRNLFDRYTFGYARHTVAVSDIVKKTIEERRTWLKGSPFSLIKNGIAPAITTAPLNRKELGLPPEAFIIGSVGRFIARKNYHWLIDCFTVIHAKHPQTHLLLMGLGPEEEKLRARVNDLGLKHNVTFIIGQPALAYYPLMDCFIQPSKQEGLSIALLEAMRAQLPCIVTSLDGNHDAIKHEQNGLIVPLVSEALIAACDSLICDRQWREKLALTAKKNLVEHYSSIGMAQQYDQLYKQHMQLHEKYYRAP